MENGPFEDVFPIKNGIKWGYSIAMLVYQRVLEIAAVFFQTCNASDPNQRSKS